jgi:hypothetical protein
LVAKPGESAQLRKVMGVHCSRQFLVGKLMLANLLCYAGLQSTLDRVSAEVVGPGMFPSGEKCLSFSQSGFRKSLKVLPIHRATP